MNMKKIISTALTVIMLLTSIIAIIPVSAFAALSSSSSSGEDEVTLTLEQVQKYIDETYLTSAYATPEEMLEADKNATIEISGEKIKINPLVESVSADGRYTIYINRYTGFVYYINNVTGQILTSNPTDVGAAGSSGEDNRLNLMSQIVVSFTEAANSKNSYEYNSVKWAARYSQISVSQINGGLRVNYTLGDTSTRFLLPGRITAKDYHDYIITPMLTSLLELYNEVTLANGLTEEEAAAKLKEEYYTQLSSVTKNVYTDKDTLYYEYTNSPSVSGTYSQYVYDNKKIEAYISAISTICSNKDYLTDETKTAVKGVKDLSGAIMQIIVKYGLKDINDNDFYNAKGEVQLQGMIDSMLADYPLCETTPIYVFDYNAFANNIISTLRQYANIIKTYCPDYTFTMMYEDEKECGFEYSAAQKPVFRCSLEYTFNSDGSLSVRLPANSISFDETAYNLTSITPIQYFGCGDMSNPEGGYLFYPDGSGSVLEFSDFYTDSKKIALNLESKVYGQDYCYSAISGKHREQITMPVFGMVSNTNANKTTQDRFGLSEVTNGFFTIIEEGNSLATLGFTSGGSSHKYVASYASYNPYPTDKFELSGAVSVGSTSEWNVMVGDVKYSGSYVSRIVMLTDKNIGDACFGKGNYYDASYTGMANYYRGILKANGTLTALKDVEASIPLYIEALGAMTITSKFLTFPVEKSISLTTFDDIATMYSELSDAKAHVEALYANYKQLSETEENDLLRIEYAQKAETFKNLIGKIDNITNVNFKLTGFANGGMNFTYPTKLKWEKCCGGKSGFEDLVATSAEKSKAAGYSLGIYPDFDFLYINNTASFDGIGNKGNVSRMVDNRYASKQVYNSVLGEFESFFSMVISTDTLDEHFAKFNKKYSKFENDKISLSTLGSDLNSNFDAKNTVSRDASQKNSVALLEKIAYECNYDIMIDTGNIYAAKYASHILNASVDFSSFRFSSYAVPFVGMILHGYVNYSGSPLNYSGTPDYEVLRAIESGANPYYILCYQNTAYMKDDEVLSDYYGIDYANWYDEILATYKKLNDVLAPLQTYEIVDHQTLTVERTASKDERLENFNLLKAELLAMIAAQLSDYADATVNAYGNSAKVTVNEEALYAQCENILSAYESELSADEANTKENYVSLKEAICALAIEYANKYDGTDMLGGEKFAAVVDAETGVAYDDYRDYSDYVFTTDSSIQDADYEATEYTLDNGNVVMVTYQKGDSICRYILNYNLYTVSVRVNAGEKPITIPSYGYVAVTLK